MLKKNVTPFRIAKINNFTIFAKTKEHFSHGEYKNHYRTTR